MKAPTRTKLALSISVLLGGISANAQIGSPLALPGHVLWLDADDFNGDGVVDTGASGSLLTSWVDKSSGQGINTVSVTAGAPTQQFAVANGHNTAQFTGNSLDKLDNSTLLVSNDYTIFTVVQHSGTAGNHVLSGLNSDGTDAVLFRGGNSFHFYNGQATGNVQGTVVNRAGPTTYKLFGYQMNSAGGDTGLFQSVLTPLSTPGTGTLNGIRIGNIDRATPSATTPAEAWSGQIAEVIVYERALTAAETANVNKYLNTKYNLGIAFATGAMTETETGHVTAGTPSVLDGTSEPQVTGRINGALSANGGVAFAQDFIGGARDFRPFRLNDGQYANPDVGPGGQEPWIAGNLESFAGIKLSMGMTIDRIGFQGEFGARRNGAFIFEYTLDNLSGVPADANLGLNPGAIGAVNWQILDVQQIQDATDVRHLYSFTPIAGVTGVRLRLESSSAETAVSELEVWAVPEPASAILVLTGALGLVMRRRRQ
ncbi:MAG: hypothetical protein JWQ44_62 [Chthoniobacter sp.]|nr:hypothetical protein [Chthoniobacter sp.]